ncbi:hypothetical protein BCF44_108144 [Kutzneria buriramensis]|uniref:Uncharacterized protein n=1 Tax=Kutzneria buriramensis TaxID=1045776 RepID=A0A3E0HG37_9PSEU|nr:hypothetical protein BCF44_108144 [Kutzneria buriramensis]
MAGNPWDTRPVLELDITAAKVFVEVSTQSPKQGGRWLVFPDVVWWELPDGGGYRKSVYAPDSFPGKGFTSAG